MNTTNNYQLPPFIVKFIEANFLKIELALASLFFIGLGLKSLVLASPKLLLLLPCGTLGILYFLSAAIPPNENNPSKFRIIAFKVLHISWAMATVGLLFLLQNYPGAMLQASFGGLTMLSALTLIILTSLKNWNVRLTQSIIRSLILLLLLYVFTSTV